MAEAIIEQEVEFLNSSFENQVLTLQVLGRDKSASNDDPTHRAIPTSKRKLYAILIVFILLIEFP